MWPTISERSHGGHGDGLRPYERYQLSRWIQWISGSLGSLDGKKKCGMAIVDRRTRLHCLQRCRGSSRGLATLLSLGQLSTVTMEVNKRCKSIRFIRSSSLTRSNWFKPFGICEIVHVTFFRPLQSYMDLASRCSRSSSWSTVCTATTYIFVGVPAPNRSVASTCHAALGHWLLQAE